MIIGILGSSGMAGSMIYNYLKERGHTVVGFSRSKVEGLTDHQLNLHNPTHLENLYMWIQGRKPTAVINCTGVLVKESADNPAEAVYINGYFPHLLESYCKEGSCKVIHLSTDCIFDGQEGFPYYEDSIPNATDWYGRSKAIGEINNDKDITLRQSIIGPAPQVNNTGFLNWILTQKKDIVTGYSQASWNGITTLELAKNIERILTDHIYLSGVFHLVPEGITNKYDMLVQIRNIWGLNTTIENSLDNGSYKILENTREDFPVVIPDFDQQLIELYEYMQERNIKVGHLN